MIDYIFKNLNGSSFQYKVWLNSKLRIHWLVLLEIWSIEGGKSRRQYKPPVLRSNIEMRARDYFSQKKLTPTGAGLNQSKNLVGDSRYAANRNPDSRIGEKSGSADSNNEFQWEVEIQPKSKLHLS